MKLNKRFSSDKLVVGPQKLTFMGMPSEEQIVFAWKFGLLTKRRKDLIITRSAYPNGYNLMVTPKVDLDIQDL